MVDIIGKKIHINGIVQGVGFRPFVYSIAQEFNISRSHLFELAIEKYITNYQNQNLLDKLNQAYDDQDDPNETQRLAKMSKRQREQLEGEW